MYAFACRTWINQLEQLTCSIHRHRPALRTGRWKVHPHTPAPIDLTAHLGCRKAHIALLQWLFLLDVLNASRIGCTICCTACRSALPLLKSFSAPCQELAITFNVKGSVLSTPVVQVLVRLLQKPAGDHCFAPPSLNVYRSQDKMPSRPLAMLTQIIASFQIRILQYRGSCLAEASYACQYVHPVVMK